MDFFGGSSPISGCPFPPELYPPYSHLFACLENQLAWKAGVLAETSRSQLHQTVLVCCDKSSESGAPGHWPNMLGTSFLEKKTRTSSHNSNKYAYFERWMRCSQYWLLKIHSDCSFYQNKSELSGWTETSPSPCGDRPAASSTWDLLEGPVCRPAKLKLE